MSREEGLKQGRDRYEKSSINLEGESREREVGRYRIEDRLHAGKTY